VNRPGSEGGRALGRALASSLLSGFLSLGTWEPPPWRLEPRPPPAAMLVVGEPTPGLAYRTPRQG
jgi:hypothetical protein